MLQPCAQRLHAMAFDLTTIIAIYGAALATVGIGLHLRAYIEDRPRFVVEANHHVLYTSEEGAHKLGIKVTNKGRANTLEACGFKIATRSDENMLTVMDPTLPKRLAKDESFTSFADPSEMKVDTILFAWARDASGRVYRSKKKPFLVEG